LLFFASIPAFDLKFFGRLFLWCFWKSSISLNTMRQASFGLRIKSLFLHFSAYSYCHFLFALRFSRSSSCLASLNLFVFSSEGHLRQFLKALFLFPIRSIRRFSDSENQSGLFLVSLSASSVAVSTTYSSYLLSKSFVERRFVSSGLRSSRKLLILILKFSNSLFLRMVLSNFFWRVCTGVLSFF